MSFSVQIKLEDLLQLSGALDGSPATQILNQLTAMEARIMAKFDEYQAAVEAAHAAQTAALDAAVSALGIISTEVGKVAADEANLNQQIADLKAQLGNLTPTQEAILDNLAAAAAEKVARTQAVATAIQTAASQVTALDEAVPDLPAPPPKP